jgi:hypothetical protein
VISASPALFGALTANCRSSTFGATGKVCFPVRGRLEFPLLSAAQSHLFADPLDAVNAHPNAMIGKWSRSGPQVSRVR